MMNSHDKKKAAEAHNLKYEQDKKAKAEWDALTPAEQLAARALRRGRGRGKGKASRSMIMGMAAALAVNNMNKR